MTSRFSKHLKTWHYRQQYLHIDFRGGMLALAVLLLAICLASPHATLPRRVFDWFIVLDITQSRIKAATASAAWSWQNNPSGKACAPCPVAHK